MRITFLLLLALGAASPAAAGSLMTPTLDDGGLGVQTELAKLAIGTKSNSQDIENIIRDLQEILRQEPAIVPITFGANNASEDGVLLGKIESLESSIRRLTSNAESNSKRIDTLGIRLQNVEADIHSIREQLRTIRASAN